MVKHRLHVIIAAVAVGSALLGACGDERASSTTAVSSGGSTPSSTTPSSTPSSSTVPATPPTTAGAMVDEGAPSTATGSGGSATTGSVISTAAVQAVIEGQPWAGQIGKVAVSPGSEPIITIVASDQSVPAVQVCTAVRDTFVGDHPDVSVNVWFAPAQDPSGEGRQLATALAGSPCESV